ncbi:hypothetical protein [Ekhidna sp.]
MLKILIILVLIGYVFYKITSFIFSGMFRGFTRNQEFSQRSYKTRNRNVNVDPTSTRQSKKTEGFSGGEYIDYEEVK